MYRRPEPSQPTAWLVVLTILLTLLIGERAYDRYEQYRDRERLKAVLDKTFSPESGKRLEKLMK